MVCYVCCFQKNVFDHLQNHLFVTPFYQTTLTGKQLVPPEWGCLFPHSPHQPPHGASSPDFSCPDFVASTLKISCLALDPHFPSEYHLSTPPNHCATFATPVHFAPDAFLPASCSSTILVPVTCPSISASYSWLPDPSTQCWTVRSGCRILSSRKSKDASHANHVTCRSWGGFGAPLVVPARLATAGKVRTTRSRSSLH
jgi:hypothetical protein